MIQRSSMYLPKQYRNRNCEVLFKEYAQRRKQLLDELTKDPARFEEQLIALKLVREKEREIEVVCPGVVSQSFLNPSVLNIRHFLCPGCHDLGRLIPRGKDNITLEFGSEAGKQLGVSAYPIFGKDVSYSHAYKFSNDCPSFCLNPSLFKLTGGLLLTELAREKGVDVVQVLAGHRCGGQFHLLNDRPETQPLDELKKNLAYSRDPDGVVLSWLKQLTADLKQLSEHHLVWTHPSLDKLRFRPSSERKGIPHLTLDVDSVAATIKGLRLRPHDPSVEERLGRHHQLPGRIWHSIDGRQEFLIYTPEETLDIVDLIQSGVDVYPTLTPLVLVAYLLSMTSEDLKTGRPLECWRRLWHDNPPHVEPTSSPFDVLYEMADRAIPLDWVGEFEIEIETE